MYLKSNCDELSLGEVRRLTHKLGGVKGVRRLLAGKTLVVGPVQESERLEVDGSMTLEKFQVDLDILGYTYELFEFKFDYDNPDFRDKLDELWTSPRKLQENIVMKEQANYTVVLAEVSPEDLGFKKKEKMDLGPFINRAAEMLLQPLTYQEFFCWARKHFIANQFFFKRCILEPIRSGIQANSGSAGLRKDEASDKISGFCSSRYLLEGGRFMPSSEPWLFVMDIIK